MKLLNVMPLLNFIARDAHIKDKKAAKSTKIQSLSTKSSATPKIVPKADALTHVVRKAIPKSFERG